MTQSLGAWEARATVFAHAVPRALPGSGSEDFLSTALGRILRENPRSTTFCGILTRVREEGERKVDGVREERKPETERIRG